MATSCSIRCTASHHPGYLNTNTGSEIRMIASGYQAISLLGMSCAVVGGVEDGERHERTGKF